MTGVESTGCGINYIPGKSLTYEGYYAVYWSDATGQGGTVRWPSDGSGGTKTVVIYGYTVSWGYDGMGCG